MIQFLFLKGISRLKKEKKTESIEGISIHTNQAEKNILTTGDHIK
jgi:hypothetical protein